MIAWVHIFGLPMAAAWVWLARVPRMGRVERSGAALLFGVGLPSALWFLWRISGAGFTAYRAGELLLRLVAIGAGLARGGLNRSVSGAGRAATGTLGLALLAGLLCLIYAPTWSGRSKHTSQLPCG